MASKARAAFDKNCKDIERLLEIHSDVGGNAQGRRHGLEVLNKSAIVMISAIWEAYCEDIVAEAVEHIVEHADADHLSKGIKKIVAKELKADMNELAMWKLADDGWKKVLKTRLARLQDERNRRLNTPKSDQIKELFEQALGIDDITTSWAWKRMKAVRARKKLNDYVTLRGDIAHRGRAANTCRKSQVDSFLNHVTRLVGKTGGRVKSYAKNITGQSLW